MPRIRLHKRRDADRWEEGRCHLRDGDQETFNYLYGNVIDTDANTNIGRYIGSDSSVKNLQTYLVCFDLLLGCLAPWELTLSMLNPTLLTISAIPRRVCQEPLFHITGLIHLPPSSTKLNLSPSIQLFNTRLSEYHHQREKRAYHEKLNNIRNLPLRRKQAETWQH